MPDACIFIKKETLAQVLSCEFGEISNNNFCYRTPPMAASVEWRFCICYSRVMENSLIKQRNVHRLISAI